MNYKPILIEKLKEFSQLGNDFSFGDLIYSILRGNCVKRPEGIDIKWIREITDEDFYTSLEKNIKIEEEFKKESNNGK